MDKNDSFIFSEDIRRRRNMLLSFLQKIKYGLRKNKIVYSKSNKLYIKKTAKIELSGKLYLSKNQRGIRDSQSILILQDQSSLKTNGDFNIGYGADIRLFDNASIEFGENSYINNNVLIRCANRIVIGDRCAISYNCTILDSDFHEVSYEGNDCNNKKAVNDVVIGNHVWIGANVTILKGVSIGENSVIGAGSVVTRSIPENSMAVGNPAKVIRKVKSWG